MSDDYADHSSSLSSPVHNAAAVTPHDTNDLSKTTRGVYVGVSGDVKVDLAGGDTVTFVGLAAGVIHPLRVTRIYSTGTTATSILGVW